MQKKRRTDKSDQLALPYNEPKPAVELPLSYSRKLGIYAQVLAESLPGLSLDVVKVIGLYLVCGGAQPDTTPAFLFKFADTAPQSAAQFHGAEKFMFPVTVHPRDGSLWIGDTNSIKIFTPEGVYKRQFTTFPWGIALVENEVFVTQNARGRVDIYAESGKPLRWFGDFGSDEHEFTQMSGIAYSGSKGSGKDSRGLLFITDWDKSQVKVFTTDGDFVRSWNTGINPSFVLVRDHEVFVALNANSIEVYDQTGKKLRSFGTTGSGPCEFRRPRGMAFDVNGNLLVCDDQNKRVQALRPSDGSFITQFVTGLSVFEWPEAVAIGLDGRIYVTVLGPSRPNPELGVCVFGFPQEG